MAEQECINCKKSIPVISYELHIVHCERFLFSCEKCGEVLKKTEKTRHMQENHSKVKCEFCSQQFEQKELNIHQHVCPAKGRSCLYCSAVFDLYNLTQHENNCGNRTDLCEICGKYIRLNLMDSHIIECISKESIQPAASKRKPDMVNPAKKRLKNAN